MELEETAVQFIDQALRTKYASEIASCQRRLAQLDFLKENLVMELISSTGLDRELIQDIFPKPVHINYNCEQTDEQR